MFCNTELCISLGQISYYHWGKFAKRICYYLEKFSVHGELGGSAEGRELQQVEGALPHSHQDSRAYAGWF